MDIIPEIIKGGVKVMKQLHKEEEIRKEEELENHSEEIDDECGESEEVTITTIVAEEPVFSIGYYDAYYDPYYVSPCFGYVY